MLVKKIEIYPIFDSIGNKTIETKIEAILDGKHLELISSSPSGASKSRYEAPVIPIETAIKHLNKIKSELCDNHSQESFDKILRKNIKILGSQATTALSMAFFSSNRPRKSFPNMLGNVFEGGVHVPHETKNWIQEILLTPKAASLPEAIKINSDIWKEVGEAVKAKGHHHSLGFESGWTANVAAEEALDIVSGIAKQHKARIGVDAAASSFYKKGKYIVANKEMKKDQYFDYILEISRTYKLFYIEDPFHQDDFKSFAQFRKKTKALVCGDDLTSTNMARLKKAVKHNSINAMIIKPNQIGTITDSLKCIEFCKKKKIMPVVSHRAGETDSDSKAMALLSQHAPIAKFGIAGERKNKLNELLRMWHSTKGRRMSRI